MKKLKVKKILLLKSGTRLEYDLVYQDNDRYITLVTNRNGFKNTYIVPIQNIEYLQVNEKI